MEACEQWRKYWLSLGNLICTNCSNRRTFTKSQQQSVWDGRKIFFRQRTPLFFFKVPRTNAPQLKNWEQAQTDVWSRNTQEICKMLWAWRLKSIKLVFFCKSPNKETVTDTWQRKASHNVVNHLDSWWGGSETNQHNSEMKPWTLLSVRSQFCKTCICLSTAPTKTTQLPTEPQLHLPKRWTFRLEQSADELISRFEFG